MNRPTDRSTRIDTMRGIACVLLVLYHVIGDTPATGLRVPAGDPVAEFNSVVMYVRMPMFAFLSGFVYALRPFQGDLPGFLKGKFRRLIVPMLIVGTIFFFVQASTPGANAVSGSWKTIHIIPVGHFWFLESMFWVFLLVALLDARRWLATPWAVLIAFFLAWAAHHLVPSVEYFGISGALYLLPYFLTGIFAQRFGVGKPGLVLAAIALVAGLAAVIWALLGDSALPGRVSLPALAIGVAVCVLMNASGLKLEWVARIGAYSFGIYMFHVFFTAASRIGLARLGVTDLAWLAAAGVTAGILGPILVEVLMKRLAPAAYRWTFGVSPKPSRAAESGPAAWRRS